MPRHRQQFAVAVAKDDEGKMLPQRGLADRIGEQLDIVVVMRRGVVATVEQHHVRTPRCQQFGEGRLVRGSRGLEAARTQDARRFLRFRNGFAHHENTCRPHRRISSHPDSTIHMRRFAPKSRSSWERAHDGRRRRPRDRAAGSAGSFRWACAGAHQQSAPRAAACSAPASSRPRRVGLRAPRQPFAAPRPHRP